MSPAVLLLMGAALAADWTDDPVPAAVIAEMERAARLSLDDVPPPHFVAAEGLSVSRIEVRASLGGVLEAGAWGQRSLGVEVRVGTPEVDSANFREYPLGDGFEWESLPLEDDAVAAGRVAWLLFDQSYKEAAENLARKEAARRQQPVAEGRMDFRASAPVSLADVDGLQPVALAKTDAPVELVDAAREASAAFLAAPSVVSSSVEVDVRSGERFRVDTLGTRVLGPARSATVTIRARAQAPDGEQISDVAVFRADTYADLPPPEEWAAEARAMADRLEAWSATPATEASYVGPVSFEGQAAVDLVSRLLVGGLGGTPEEEEADRFTFGPGGGGVGPLRLRRRVLPPGYDVTVLASEDWGAFGAPVDGEGERSTDVVVVQDGIVRSLLGSRTPGDDPAAAPTGHAWGGFGELKRASARRVRVDARETPARKRDRLATRTAQAYDEPAVLVIRRLGEAAGGFGRFSGGDESLLPPPIDAVLRAPDGTETPVRGLVFEGASPAMLRDALAAGPSVVGCRRPTPAGAYRQAPWAWIEVPELLVAEAALVPDPEPPAPPGPVPSPLAGR